jgi:hypothetical protein
MTDDVDVMFMSVVLSRATAVVRVLYDVHMLHMTTFYDLISRQPFELSVRLGVWPFVPDREPYTLASWWELPIIPSQHGQQLRLL